MPYRVAVAFLVVISGFISTSRADEPAKGVIPVFRLDTPITESPAGESLPIFDAPGESLKDLLERMGKAAKDPAVKAVVVVSENLGAGSAQIEEIRQAMGEIKSAGKEVYVHADSATMLSYLLFSNATRLSVTPTADLWLGGIQAESPYLRGMLDKIGVEPDFLTCGEYKSAGEIFTRTGPSKPAEDMTNWLIDGIYGSLVQQIATGRKMPDDQVKQRIDAGLYSAEKAKAAGLVDAVEHRQDFEAMLREKFGATVKFDRKYAKKSGPEMDLSSPFAAFKIWGDLLAGSKKKAPTGPSIAIVYVDGMIVPGSKQPSLFGGTVATSSDIRKALDEAAADDTVKAVVLRINSPGGSAVASEIILDATKRVRKNKPFVVSMGDVAGSGGYYVACGADKIFADETTITGSIGVVAGKLVTTAMWDKVGITFKDYSRGKNAGLLSSSQKFTDEQRQQLQSWMDEVYGVFKGHVTAARGSRLKKPIDELAGGRVYTGKQALELGLVDEIGTMSDAIRSIAKEAKLQDYAVRVIPEPKNFVELMMEGLSGDKADDAKHVMTGGSTSISKLALPYLQQLDPARVGAVRTALQRLDMLQQDGVILAMPEVTVAP